MNSDLKIQIEGRVGRIRLNRAQLKNAISSQMSHAISTALLAWRNSARVEFIIIDHLDCGPHFRCGSDICEMLRFSRTCFKFTRAMLGQEFKIIGIISNYPKPILVFLDGVTTGLGLGMAAAASHSVATCRTRVRFPETGFGLFPNAGSTWFLPRLKSEIGTWLSLTGTSLSGEDVVAVGLASNFCPSDDLDMLKRDLIRFGMTAIATNRSSHEFSMASQLSKCARASRVHAQPRSSESFGMTLIGPSLKRPEFLPNLRYRQR